MKKIIEKINKLSLPATILIASVIVGSLIYASQMSKQDSIERQQRAKLDLQKEQESREYIAKRKLDCLAIYETESEKWSNVTGWKYYGMPYMDGFTGDWCEIKYKNDKGEYFTKNF